MPYAVLRGGQIQQKSVDKFYICPIQCFNHYLGPYFGSLILKKAQSRNALFSVAGGPDPAKVIPVDKF
jgi:hypothetical protein